MCLILFAVDVHPLYRLALAANRDEFYDRPTAPLHEWNDFPHIVAGRDLKSGGTWLGLTKTGRFAAITNYREPSPDVVNPISRGELVRNFLAQSDSPECYITDVAKTGDQYKGFNLIVGDLSEIWYYSNRNQQTEKLGSGVYGLSNRFLNTPWQKVEKGKAAVQAASQRHRINPDDLFDALADRSYPPDTLLPDTGVGVDWERLLSPIFVVSDSYGTRCSSVILIEKNGKILFIERSFDPKSLSMFQTRMFSADISQVI